MNVLRLKTIFKLFLFTVMFRETPCMCTICTTITGLQSNKTEKRNDYYNDNDDKYNDDDNNNHNIGYGNYNRFRKLNHYIVILQMTYNKLKWEN